MPWSNQGDGGGPWGKKSGSGPSDPKGSGNKGFGPGGQGPWGGGSSGGGQGPQGLDQLFQQGQDHLKNLMPDGPMSGRGGSLIGALVVVGWMATGLYIVHPDEIGLNLVFGRYEGSTQPGLNYNWPAPVGSVIKPRVTAVNTTDVGVGVSDNRTGRGDPSSLMLTGDENIVYVDFAVQWQINPAKAADSVRASEPFGVGPECAICVGRGVPPAPKLMFGPPFSPSLALGVAQVAI
jgi:membrane protease subunit HflK